MVLTMPSRRELHASQLSLIPQWQVAKTAFLASSWLGGHYTKSWARTVGPPRTRLTIYSLKTS